MNDLIALALQECQKIYRANFPESETERQISQYGCFPKTAIVKYCSKITKEEVSGKTIKAWIMGMNFIESLTDLSTIGEPEYISGLFFSEGVFSFAVSKDTKHLALDMILGPKYGCGLYYDIELGDSGYILINRITIWVA